MKLSMESARNASPEAAPGSAGASRDEWPRWIDALRRYQLEGLVGWFLDAGRPLAILSAQLLYIAGPYVGTSIERVGKMLETDDEARAFAQLLNSHPGDAETLTRGGPAG